MTATLEPVEKCVLLVDDDPAILGTMRLALDRPNCEVHVARDGYEALNVAARFEPDVVVLDIIMPKLDGFQVLERLRGRVTKPLRVIIITGNEAKGHRAYAEIVGANDFLSKPFAMNDLVDSVWQ
jgi:DNA-binding response OmpR family regulator